MITKEVAKKPNARTRVQCAKCGKQFPFSPDAVIEEQLTHPSHVTVVEGFLVCPKCGLKKHSYYMSERLRFDLSKLQLAGQAWSKEKSDKTWKRYEVLHRSYVHNFDREQEKFKKLMNPEVEDGQIAG